MVPRPVYAEVVVCHRAVLPDAFTRSLCYKGLHV